MVSIERSKDKYKSLADESEVLSPDEAHARVITELSRNKDPASMTELTDPEIKNLALVMTTAERTNNRVLEAFGNWFMKLRVSYRRKGREELIRVSRSSADLEEKVKKGIMSYIMAK